MWWSPTGANKLLCRPDKVDSLNHLQYLIINPRISEHNLYYKIRLKGYKSKPINNRKYIVIESLWNRIYESSEWIWETYWDKRMVINFSKCSRTLKIHALRKKIWLNQRKWFFLNDFLWFREMICLNEIKFVRFKRNNFEQNKYLFESN